MHILLVGEYPFNVLKFGYLFIRVVCQGPSRALICSKIKKIVCYGHIQDALSDCGQAKLSSVSPRVYNKVNNNI